MARRPTPTELKKLAGNPGHRPLNDAEPQPMRGIPEMPKGLRPAARREWNRIAPALEQLGVLSRIDGKALAMYCDCYADWEEAQRDCVKNGLVLDTPIIDRKTNLPIFLTDHKASCEASEESSKCSCPVRVLMQRKENPAFTVKQKAMKTMKSFLIEFGLTPASRCKLKVEAPKGKSDFDDFLNRSPQAAQAAAKEAAPLMFNTGKPAGKSGMPVPAVSNNDFEA